jgi:hypothetical protein
VNITDQRPGATGALSPGRANIGNKKPENLNLVTCNWENIYTYGVELDKIVFLHFLKA